MTKFHTILQQHEAGSKVSYLQLPVSMNLCYPSDARVQCKQVQARMKTITYLSLAATRVLAPAHTSTEQQRVHWLHLYITATL